MAAMSHQELVGFTWQICDLLRGAYKRNEYRKVILPLTVLRRFDCEMANTKDAVQTAYESSLELTPEVRHALLLDAAERNFYNTSPFNFKLLLNDPPNIAQNLLSYINGFSDNIRDIIEKFGFDVHIRRLAEKNLLYNVMQKFESIDLSPSVVDNVQMGYVLEELIRIGAEQSNEEAGEHFTPREVIRLIGNLILSPETDLHKEGVVKTIYDPACGTGGMLSVAEEFLREHNSSIKPILYGQDYNDESWAICKADILIKGGDADLIALGDSLIDDKHTVTKEGTPLTFDYMMANPPFGVAWHNQYQAIKNEHDTLGFDGSYGPGLPRISDGSLLFLLKMLSKMTPKEKGGSRIGIVFNGSPLFSGDAGSGESEIRRWIIENDLLEAIVALPDQLFYNTGIFTYIWILTNNKENRRIGKVQLIDARNMFTKMTKSLGNKRNEISQEYIAAITKIHGNFIDGETRDIVEYDPISRLPRSKSKIVSKIFDNDYFGYQKVAVDRPLRLNFRVTPDRIEKLKNEKAFVRLTQSKKTDKSEQDAAIAEGEVRQQQILAFLCQFGIELKGKIYLDMNEFTVDLNRAIRKSKIGFTKSERAAILSALSERDPYAAKCLDDKGNIVPDSDLRMIEVTLLTEDLDSFMQREVIPYAPDAWLDCSKTKIGYAVLINKYFYEYEPPRAPDQIALTLRTLESEFITLMAEVIA